MLQTPTESTIPEKKPRPGQFQPGNKLGGRTATGFQSFKDRLQWWLETKTLAEIKATVSNPKSFNKLVSIDAMVARRIYAACEKDGSGADFALVLDRLLGKPAQSITGEDGKPLLAAIDVNELARRTAFLLSLPNAAAPITIDQHLVSPKPSDTHE